MLPTNIIKYVFSLFKTTCLPEPANGSYDTFPSNIFGAENFAK